jgi:uncharacterized protein
MFLDTSGLMGVFVESEPYHEECVQVFDAARAAFTTDYVLVEFVALATARRASRIHALDFVARLVDTHPVEVVFVEEPTLLAALELLVGRPDKSWSLCDAVSFVLMEVRDEWEALTLDHHFEQAGFVRVPAVGPVA